LPAGAEAPVDDTDAREGDCLRAEGRASHALIADAATWRISVSVAPLAAWTASPFRTVTTDPARVVQSAPLGRSPSCMARSNHSRNAAAVACCKRAGSRRTG
jgi:hypothetical protein